MHVCEEEGQLLGVLGETDAAGVLIHEGRSNMDLVTDLETPGRLGCMCVSQAAARKDLEQGTKFVQ